MNPGFWYDSPALHTYPIHSKHLRVTPLWFINVVIHSFKEFEFEFIWPKMYLSDKYRASLLQSAKLPPDCKKIPNSQKRHKWHYLCIAWLEFGLKSSKDRKWYWEENISWCTNSECSIERCLDWTLLLHFSFWCLWCFRFTKDYRLRRTTFKGPISLLGNLLCNLWHIYITESTHTVLQDL